MCGVLLVSSLKKREELHSKYKNDRYLIMKVLITLEKMRNRGQDGGGLLVVKKNTPPGTHYIKRIVCPGSEGVFEIISKVTKSLEENSNEFIGDIYLGHLRYGTFGGYMEHLLHPVLHLNNWKTRTIGIAGNFNLTNVQELFNLLVELGQHPHEVSDTILVLEKFVHFLNEEVESCFKKFKEEGYSNIEITELIADNLSIENVIRRTVKDFDGGYVIGGVLGYGASFVVRDPWGIRPAYFYNNEDFAVIASEKPPIITAFAAQEKDISEVPPGCAVIISHKGTIKIASILPSNKKFSCSFERIYFSRGTDKEIYNERKNLGKELAQNLIKKEKINLDKTVFSYVPNTSQAAFLGFIEELENIFPGKKIRAEIVLVKDVKIRTFIMPPDYRKELHPFSYDVNYGALKRNEDTLVIIDDSIVRGTTLKHSILKILEKLQPKKVIVLSSAPQIRYPDFYGIDMSSLSELAAFNALVRLLRKKSLQHLLMETYYKCKEYLKKENPSPINFVKKLYEIFTEDEISDEISVITGENVSFPVKIIFQTVESLRKALPNHQGYWYFTGEYPTIGGYKMVNKAYVDFYEGKYKRAYEIELPIT